MTVSLATSALSFFAPPCRLFGSKVRFWTTFNEANVTSFAGHLYGSFPPGKVAQITGCGRHLLHMLRAHTQAYQAIKALPGGDMNEVSNLQRRGCD